MTKKHSFMRKTHSYSMKKAEIDKKWILIDASDLVLGRLAADVANILRGKNKATFTPHMDCGDNAIVINAKKVALTGAKLSNKGKLYYRHTGFPGGIKEASAKEIMAGKHPERIFKFAVKRMLPKGALGNTVFSHLYVYSDADHPHEAQTPALYDFGSKNKKNKR